MESNGFEGSINLIQFFDNLKKYMIQEHPKKALKLDQHHNKEFSSALNDIKAVLLDYIYKIESSMKSKSTSNN